MSDILSAENNSGIKLCQNTAIENMRHFMSAENV